MGLNTRMGGRVSQVKQVLRLMLTSINVLKVKIYHYFFIGGMLHVLCWRAISTLFGGGLVGLLLFYVSWPMTKVLISFSSFVVNFSFFLYWLKMAASVFVPLVPMLTHIPCNRHLPGLT